MNKPNKCKNCQWYGKPYWSIINPCDSCPNENDYKTTIIVDGELVFKKALTEEEIKKAMTEEPQVLTRWIDPTIQEKDEEIERLNNIINELEKWLESEIKRISKLKNPKKRIAPYGEENYYYENMILRYKECKDKLKELKEGK